MENVKDQSSEINPMAKFMLDAIKPVVVRVIAEMLSGEIREGIADNTIFQKMTRKMLSQELGKLPEGAREALEKTEVSVVRQADSVEIVIGTGGDSDVEKVRNVLLDSLLGPISQIVSLFGCKVNIGQPA